MSDIKLPLIQLSLQDERFKVTANTPLSISYDRYNVTSDTSIDKSNVDLNVTFKSGIKKQLFIVKLNQSWNCPPVLRD